MKDAGGVATVGLTGATIDVISRTLTINVSILPIVSVSIGIIMAIAIKIILNEDMPGKVKKAYKVRILPDNLYEELTKIFACVGIQILMLGVTYVVSEEPNNLFYFLGLVLISYLVLVVPRKVLSGKMKVKFIRVID